MVTVVQITQCFSMCTCIILFERKIIVNMLSDAKGLINCTKQYKEFLYLHVDLKCV